MNPLLRAHLRGLYGIADADCGTGDPVRLAEQLLDGGCRVIQLRCKSWSIDDIERAAIAVNQRCVERSALFFVNDHAEVAAAVGATGVHLGQTDISSEVIRRRHGSGLLIGRSTNALDQIPATLPNADYLAFGPVFTTTNLSRAKPVQGLELLSQARHLATSLPLVAIGGITKERLGAIKATGVDAWAVISAIAGASDPVAATRDLCE